MTHQSSKEASSLAKDLARELRAMKYETDDEFQRQLAEALDSFARRARLEALEEAARIVYTWYRFPTHYRDELAARIQASNKEKT